MKRHVPSTQVGTAMVLQALGVERLSDLAGWNDDATPLGQVTGDIHTVVRRLDGIQDRLVGLARSIRDDLNLVIDGHDSSLVQATGLLGSSAQSLDALVLRRTELVERLEALNDLHRVLAPAPALTPPPTVGPAVTLDDVQLRALDAVARGKAIVSEHSPLHGRQFWADGLELHPPTANSLIERRLVDRDTSTSLYQGPQLRLTPIGARVHAAVTGTATASRAPAPADNSTAAAAITVRSTQNSGRAR